MVMPVFEGAADLSIEPVCLPTGIFEEEAITIDELLAVSSSRYTTVLELDDVGRQSISPIIFQVRQFTSLIL